MTAETNPQQYQRAVMGLPFTVEYVFGENGDSLPDAAPTYTVTNAAGSSVASGTASLGSVSSGQQTASFDLTPSELPAVDLLSVTWSYTVSTVAVEVTSLVDVCGCRLFPLADYNQFAELSSVTAAQQEQQRMFAEDLLERECGMAFTGRYRSQRFTLREPPDLTWFPSPLTSGWDPGDQSYGETGLVLDRPFVQAIRSITQTTVDDEGNSTTSQLNLTYARYDQTNGVLYFKDNLGNGIFGDAVVGYEHGQWVADVRRICLILARYRLLNGPLEARAIAMPAEGGGSLRLLQPGSTGASPTGIPEVDEFIARYNRNALGFVSGGL